MEILYIILSLIFLGIVIRRPVWGGYIILATLPSYLLRFDILGIPTTVLEINIWLWFVVAIYNVFCRGRLQTCLYPTMKMRNIVKQILNNKIFLLFIIFIVIGLLSTLVADDIRLALGAWKGWMLDPFLFLLTALLNYNKNTSFNAGRDVKINTKRYARSCVSTNALIYASMITIGLVAIWGLVEYIGGFGMQLPGVVNAMFTSANYVALLIIPLWFLSLGLSLDRFYKNSLTNKQIILWIIFHLAVLVTILLTKSYAGLLALGVGGVYTLLSLPKDFKYRKIIFGFAVVIAVGLASSIMTSDKFASYKNIHNYTKTVSDHGQIITTAGSYNSLDTRKQIWTVTWDLIKQNLILGIGFGNFEPVYYKRAFELYDPPLEWEVPRAHNLFLHTQVEVGVFGLAILVILLIQILIILKKSLKSSDNYFITIGIIAAVLSIIIHGLLDTPYYKNDLSIVFVLLLLLIILDNKKILLR